MHKVTQAVLFKIETDGTVHQNGNIRILPNIYIYMSNIEYLYNRIFCNRF